MSAKPFNIDSLLAYLKGSGTGKVKLDALTKLAGEVDSFTEFTEKAGTVVGAGTLDKMEEFYKANPPPAAEKAEEAVRQPPKPKPPAAPAPSTVPPAAPK